MLCDLCNASASEVLMFLWCTEQHLPSVLAGLIGEHPIGIPNNLMPYIQQVATGIRPELNVYGSDYNTRDGTAVRDYIHVMDLAEGHVAAVQKLLDNPQLGCVPINLGTGTGSTVLEMVSVSCHSSCLFVAQQYMYMHLSSMQA